MRRGSGRFTRCSRTPGRRALYDNLDKDEGLALAVDAAARASRQDDWRSNSFKIKRVRNAIRAALESAGPQGGSGSDGPYAARVREEPPAYGVKRTEPSDELVERVFELVKNENEY